MKFYAQSFQDDTQDSMGGFSWKECALLLSIRQACKLHNFYPKRYPLISHGHTRTYLDKRQNVSGGIFSHLVVSALAMAVTVKIHPG